MADQMIDDPHRDRAAKLFSVRPEDVTPEQRRYAKSMNLLTHYSTPSCPDEGDVVRVKFLSATNVLAQSAASDLCMEELEQKMAAAGFAKIDVDAWEKLK